MYAWFAKGQHNFAPNYWIYMEHCGYPLADPYNPIASLSNRGIVLLRKIGSKWGLSGYRYGLVSFQQVPPALVYVWICIFMVQAVHVTAPKIPGAFASCTIHIHSNNLPALAAMRACFRRGDISLAQTTWSAGRNVTAIKNLSTPFQIFGARKNIGSTKMCKDSLKKIVVLLSQMGSEPDFPCSEWM